MIGVSNRTFRSGVTAFAVAVATLFVNGAARAGLVLTGAGTTDGFTLSTYATGNGGVYNFLAAAPLSNGNLAVVDYQDGLLRSYADVNGQTYGSFLNSVPLTNVVNIANAGGQTYVTELGIPGGLRRITDPNTLSSAPVSVTGGFTPSYGFAGNPVTGHLLAFGTGSSGPGIYDINPLTGANTLIVAGSGFDGVSVSPDGTTVYVENNGNSIQAYNITTHALVFNHFSGHGPDGTGVISGGLYDGYIIANNNDGTVGLIDPTGATEVIIASGGTRGDFTSPDTNNGTLLLSEYGAMYRLTAPGGTFGGATPEPASLTICCILAGGMATYGWRRRKAAPTV